MNLYHLAACALIAVVTVTAILHQLDGNVVYVAILAIGLIAGVDIREAKKVV